MKPFRHGLVIGKFYPPHAGHHYLIRAAADSCDCLTVVAMPASRESIPLALRLQWLREGFAGQPHVCFTGIIDDEPVDYASAAAWEAHVGLMRKAVADADPAGTAGPVDAVFSSEHYGQELASRFGAAAVCVDQPRGLYPVSGTKVRSSPAQYWDCLAPAVQAWLCLRVVIVGAESTGKTTLAQGLAARLRARGGTLAATRWVAEYGREYSQNKLAVARALAARAAQTAPELGDLHWTSEEFVAIAAEQAQREDAASRQSGPVLIADTDAFATALWHERYRGTGSTAVEQIAQAPSPHRIYILTDVSSVPFEQDGIRDGEAIRVWMHARFANALETAGKRWKLIRGDEAEVLEQAERWVAAELATAWQFQPPLG